MIELISEIGCKNNGGFALVDDAVIRGGLRVVETFDELSLIPNDRLKDGCLAMVTIPSRVLYVYNIKLNTWSPFSSGGEGGSVWSCVGDNETIKITQNIDDWTQTISAINNIRTYEDYSVLPTEDVADNEVAYCKADAVVGLTTYKRGFYYYELSSTSWVEVNSTIEIDSALSETSKRPVQNRVVTKALDEKISKNDVDNVISKHSSNPVENRVIATALENVKNSKTMTAEEYGALDDVTKNDGSFYYISDTGEIYQNGIIYGGKQIFDITQEGYDALTNEEKAVNEYHCTDTGRVYINGILYGDKKPIELTFEEYKQLEADGKVEADVDYVIVSNKSGVLSCFLLSDIDTNHGSSNVSTYEVIKTLKSDVYKKAEILDSEKNDVNTWSSNKIASEITGVETELNANLGGLNDRINGFKNVQIVSALGSTKLKEIIQSEFPKLQNGRGMIRINDGTTLYCGTYIKYSNTQGSTTFTNVEGTSYIWTIRGDTVTLQEIATMDKVAKYPDWSNQQKISLTEITVDQDVYIELNILSSNQIEDLKINGKDVSVSDSINGIYSTKFSGYVKKGSVVSHPYLTDTKIVKVFPLV